MRSRQGDAAIESVLIAGLAQQLPRRTAERIVDDLRRNRRGAPLPRDLDALRAIVRGELMAATVLRVGARGTEAIREVDESVLAMSALPADSWEGTRVRLVYVGRGDCVAQHLADVVRATEAYRVDELHELLIALDTSERTLVVIDVDDATLDPAMLARLVPDFDAHVLTLVVGATPAVREAFLASGAAFRATLRAEPLDHGDLVHVMRDLVAGVVRTSARRKRGGPSTTTEPARAA